MRDFLDARHPGRYALVNLCDERDYQNAEWPAAAASPRITRPSVIEKKCLTSELIPPIVETKLSSQG